MNRNIEQLLKYSLLTLVFVSFLTCTDTSKDQSQFSEIVKVSLRDVGHHLLLNDNDSTSIVKPVRYLGDHKYQLAFESTLAIHPDSLVNQIKASFQKANLPEYYLTEVVECETEEVSYSYEMRENEEKGIIPCGGRKLEKACYQITVRFIKISSTDRTLSKTLYALGLCLLLVLGILLYRRHSAKKAPISNTDFTTIGRYRFYPEQSKLIKEATEINLSNKECELLALFVAQPNQIIKRDVLIKKVWEDNGVIVGRSLDTYISKLRKKLKDDQSIKITNVHGVGYKLELNT